MKLESVLLGTISSILMLAALAISAQLPLQLGVSIYTEQVLAFILGLAIAVTLLERPPRAVRPSTPLWYLNTCAAFLGLGCGIYLMLRYPTLAQNFFAYQGESTLIGLVLIPLLLEALRRSAGMGLVIVVLVFLAYALFADHVPGDLQGRAIPLTDLVAFISVDNVAIFGLPLTIIGMIVLAYIFFGYLLQISGGSRWFTDLAMCAVGRTRGGSAMMAVIASGLFGTISGSAVSNVASTGVITIPLMKQGGFTPRLAGAFEAAASTGGQILPPVMGAAAFLMAEVLQLQYIDVVKAAIVPALLFYFSLLLIASREALRLNIKPIPAEQLPRAKTVWRQGWYFPLPFAALVWLLFVWRMAPAEAILWSAALMILLNLVFGFAGKRISFADFGVALMKSGKASASIVLIGAAAGIIIGILENTGLSFGLSFVLVQLGEGNLVALLFATALICIILGMGMPTTGIYILVATLAGPSLIELGIAPLAAHLFVLYFGLMSMISPPVAMAAFTAAAIANAGPMATALTAMRIGWVAFIMPFLFVANPALLLQGDPVSIGWAIIKAAVGIWVISPGISGYCLHALGIVWRSLFLLVGTLILWPNVLGETGLDLNTAGIALALMLLASLFISDRVKGRPARLPS